MFQTPIQCPSKLNRTSHASTLGAAEVHHSRVRERERERRGLGERIRALEVLLASEREKRRLREERKNERDPQQGGRTKKEREKIT